MSGSREELVGEFVPYPTKILSQDEIKALVRSKTDDAGDADADGSRQPGAKHDAGKLRLDLIPPEAIHALGAVLTMGAEKYGPDNWRGVAPARYEAAMLRHWLSWKEGEAADAESGLPHLAHVLANAALLVALEKRVGKGNLDAP